MKEQYTENTLNSKVFNEDNIFKTLWYIIKLKIILYF